MARQRDNTPDPPQPNIARALLKAYGLTYTDAADATHTLPATWRTLRPDLKRNRATIASLVPLTPRRRAKTTHVTCSGCHKTHALPWGHVTRLLESNDWTWHPETHWRCPACA